MSEMKITPDMVVAVPEDFGCRGCVASKDNELCKSLPDCSSGLIFQLKPEYQPVQSKSELYRQQVLRGESVPRSVLEFTMQEQEARIAELEAELAKYKNQEQIQCGVSRSQWHDKAWALFQAKAFNDVALNKLSIHTIRAVFDATYDALYTNKFEE